MPRSPYTQMATLLAFDDQVRRDQDQPAGFLHRRDRRFALDCQDQDITPTPRLWLEHLNRLNGRGTVIRGDDPRLARWHRIRLGFAVAGSLFGVITMLGLLFYDGSQRINLTVILAFVLLQLLLALATTARALANGQPWRWLNRRLGIDDTGPLAALQPPLMARAAHTGGLLFGITGLVTLLVLVVVQDLAFGWSTTLNANATGYHQVLRTLATPWQTLWPAAVPDPDLVEATRFFRAGGTEPGANVQRWGHWWPFVTMVWITYVILPRLVLLVFSRFHLARRITVAQARHPGVNTLLYRMETPALDIGTGSPHAEHQPDLTTGHVLHPLPDSRLLIRWAGAGGDELPDALTHGKQVQVFSAGGSMSLSADRRTIQHVRLQLAPEAHRHVLVLVRAWEPATAELADFFTQAGEHWPGDTQITLVPLATNATERPSDHQLSQWLRFAERQQHPRLQVSLLEIASRETPLRSGGRA